MFFLSEVEHTLRLPPHLLSRPLNDAIKGELDTLFLDKVRFRMVMFRPFVGEVISARLKESTKDGLRLSVGFFDDIYIPVPLLASPNHSESDPEHKDGIRWVWEYEGENYPIDGTDEIRFRVHSVNYPPIPLEQGKDSDQKDSEQKALKPLAPMVVIGSLDADGLGPISWWV